MDAYTEQLGGRVYAHYAVCIDICIRRWAADNIMCTMVATCNERAHVVCLRVSVCMSVVDRFEGWRGVVKSTGKHQLI